MKLIRYFFYRLYTFSFTSNAGDENAQIGFGIIAYIGMRNVFSVLSVVEIILQRKIELNLIFILLFIVVYLFSLYKYLIANNGKKRILKEFENKKNNILVLNLLLVFYVVGSIFLNFYL